MAHSTPTERRITVEPGVALRVTETGAKDGPAILFCNSLAADLGMWDEVVARLPEGYRALRYDARGHGGSSVPDAGYDIARLGRDALAVLDALGIARAHVCGLSLGGLTGMWLGAEAGERLHSLTLANTAASFPPPEMWRDRAASVRAQGMADLVAPTIERWLTPAFRAAKPARTNAIARMIGATSTEGYAGCCGVLAETDLTGTLAAIACPTLVIAGAEDPSTPPARAEEIVTRLPGARLVTLPAAHLSSVEAPDAFTRALLDHIERQP